MAENTEKKPTVKAEHKEAAKVASSPDARREGGERVLAEQFAQQDADREENGTPDVIPADEAPMRAAHQGEGGGPWPEELLSEHSVNPTGALVSLRPEQLYTSHEDFDNKATDKS